MSKIILEKEGGWWNMTSYRGGDWQKWRNMTEGAWNPQILDAVISERSPDEAMSVNTENLQQPKSK